MFFYKSFAVFKNNYSALGPRVILLSFAGLRCLMMSRSYYQLGRWCDFAGLIKVHQIRAIGGGFGFAVEDYVVANMGASQVANIAIDSLCINLDIGH